MPWTKSNYPDSMKKLPVIVRAKAIEIANAILKENNKMGEGKLIATATKHAKDIAANGEKKKKSTAKKKTKSAAVKKVKTPAKSKTKSIVRKRTKKTFKAKTKSPVIKPPLTEKITHGDDLHLIPVEGEIHPVSTETIHQLENEFHHREQVAFHQGNQKVKDAMSTRKNTNRFFPNRGLR